MGLEIKEQTDAMEIGNFLEDGIGRLYSHKTGYKTAQFGTIRHAKYPWMLCTPDLCVFGQRRLAQVKIVGAFMAHHWLDGVPDYVLVQVQHEMEVCDADVCDVVALIGGTDLRIVAVERDRAMGADLVDVCRSFYEKHVVTGEMPDPDGSDTATAAIKARFRKDGPAMVVATPEVEAYAKAWLQADATIRDAEKRQALAEQHIKLAIGENAGIEGESFRVTWKATKKGTRTFLLKEAGVRKGEAA
jgi:predicted phage-related endonuclease